MILFTNKNCFNWILKSKNANKKAYLCGMNNLGKIVVLYEDNHLIAINKPAGSLVQGDETGDTPISEWVKEYIKIRYNKPGDVYLGTIHRLDRPVSGVCLFARTSKALERMNAMFAAREVEKIYWAVLESRPEEFSGTLHHFLEKDAAKNLTHAYVKNRTGNAKPAELSYEMVGEIANNYFLEVHPKTGRPHQIRAQLSKIGCPIRGDLKYGASKPLEDKSIALHARSLTFMHPVKLEQVTITADPPKIFEFWRQFADMYRK